MTVQSQEELRIRVVRAIVEQGLSQAEACRTFGVGKTSVWRWMTAYRSGGQRRLTSHKRGRKPGSSLKGHQAATVVRLITDRCPDQLKLPFALWTREAVRELIANRCGVSLSASTIGRYLKRWGFTPQKPIRRAYEQNPKAVQAWLTDEYPAIQKDAKKQGAEMHWGDEMGVRSDHQTGTSYGRKGQTPVVPGTGQRFRCNMISTVTNTGTLAFMVFKQRFTADVMIEFLRRLVRHAKRKVYLIVDRHPVHRSRKVTRWLDRHAGTIERFYLPGYSPELNPDELLNQDVKSNAIGRRRPNTQTEMIDNLRSYLRSTQKQPNVVKAYFQEQHVRDAADTA